MAGRGKAIGAGAAKKATSRSSKAGLQFPVGIELRFLNWARFLGLYLGKWNFFFPEYLCYEFHSCAVTYTFAVDMEESMHNENKSASLANRHAGKENFGPFGKLY
uniref:Uncharacterized protein n=1 Tax=Leersia perrieri TaxID=77586 RepID=A0A0D9XYZ1_9ORYZ